MASLALCSEIPPSRFGGFIGMLRIKSGLSTWKANVLAAVTLAPAPVISF